MTAQETRYGVRPEFIYRKTAPETRRILGLGATAIDDAIARGDITRPRRSPLLVGPWVGMGSP